MQTMFRPQCSHRSGRQAAVRVPRLRPGAGEGDDAARVDELAVGAECTSDDGPPRLPQDQFAHSLRVDKVHQQLRVQ